jgi:uncharacterized membrane protein YqaE (UPF0057 family)
MGASLAGRTLASTSAATEGESKVLYLVAILLPPLAVLLAGKPIQALINLFLTLLLYLPGLIHALLVVNNYYADKRTARIIRETRKAKS